METKDPIGITDLTHQLDHIKPKRIQLFQEYGIDADIARLFLILVSRRKLKY